MSADFRHWLTGAMVVLVAACSGDAAAPDPASDAPAILVSELPTEGSDSLSTLLSCHVQPVRPVSRSIGPDGGKLTIGHHVLTIPKHALTQTVRITGTVVDTNVVAIELEPAGLRFLLPATLTLDYSGCTLSGNESSLHLAYVVVDSTAFMAEHLKRDHDQNGDGHDDGDDHSISGLLDHFSRYAVAY